MRFIDAEVACHHRKCSLRNMRRRPASLLLRNARITVATSNFDQSASLLEPAALSAHTLLSLCSMSGPLGALEEEDVAPSPCSVLPGRSAVGSAVACCLGARG